MSTTLHRSSHGHSSTGRQHWPASEASTWLVGDNTHQQPRRRPLPSTGRQVDPGSDFAATAPLPSPLERAAYTSGWRHGVGHGLVAGAFAGAIGALALVWLGVQVSLRAL